MAKKEDQKVADELMDELDSVGGDLEEKAATKGEESDYDDDAPEPEGKEDADKDSEDDSDEDDSKDEEKKDDKSDDSEDEEDDEKESDDEDDSDDDDSDDSDDSDKEDDDDKDEDDDKDDASAKDGLVPVKKVMEIRRKNKERIEKYKARIATLEGGKKTDESDSKETDQKVKNLVEKYKMDEPAVKEMLEVAAEIAEKRIRQNLKLGDGEILAEAAKEVMKQKEVAHFEKEWTATEPAVKEAFPSASQEQLAEAKTLMDQLSHSKEFHTFPLDYVLFKNRKRFETVMRQPKRKTIERGSTGARASDAPADSDLPYEKMSPKQKARFERGLFGATDEGGTFVHRGGKRVRVDD